jgi:hypothetical protein
MRWLVGNAEQENAGHQKTPAEHEMRMDKRSIYGCQVLRRHPAWDVMVGYISLVQSKGGDYYQKGKPATARKNQQQRENTSSGEKTPGNTPLPSKCRPPENTMKYVAKSLRLLSFLRTR